METCFQNLARTFGIWWHSRVWSTIHCETTWIFFFFFFAWPTWMIFSSIQRYLSIKNNVKKFLEYIITPGYMEMVLLGNGQSQQQSKKCSSFLWICQLLSEVPGNQTARSSCKRYHCPSSIPSLLQRQYGQENGPLWVGHKWRGRQDKGRLQHHLHISLKGKSHCHPLSGLRKVRRKRVGWSPIKVSVFTPCGVLHDREKYREYATNVHLHSRYAESSCTPDEVGR